MAKISYSQYSMFATCPHQYKLKYIDKLGKSSGNVHTLFGTSMHSTIQHFLTVFYDKSATAAMLIDLDKLLLSNMRDEFVKETTARDGNPICSQEELEEFYGDGRRILTWLKKHIGKFYGNTGFELVGIEIPLNATIREGVNFIGYIDVAIREISDGTVHIIDLKTSTQGWNVYQKSDKLKNSQLILYKKFYSDLFGIPLTKIQIEYQIMRRKMPEDSMYPIPYISKHVPSNGSPSVNKTYTEFLEFIDSVFDEKGEYTTYSFPKQTGKANKNCKFCEFKLRDLCDGKES